MEIISIRSSKVKHGSRSSFYCIGVDNGKCVGSGAGSISIGLGCGGGYNRNACANKSYIAG